MPDQLAPIAPTGLETTVELLAQVRRRDRDALDRLFARCMPLCGGGRGPAPLAARGVLDTQDLVQDTILSSPRHLIISNRATKGRFRRP